MKDKCRHPIERIRWSNYIQGFICEKCSKWFDETYLRQQELIKKSKEPKQRI
tara:strand:+ start:8706 stop:8861 length:156 start_codon:yes stop_codon:yes gene_type:complete